MRQALQNGETKFDAAARRHSAGFLAEGIAFIERVLGPEIQRIVLQDGPAVLGDPSRWPGRAACLLDA